MEEVKALEENMEVVKSLEVQVEDLQAEVLRLQHQQQKNQKDMMFDFRGPMQDALSYLLHQEGGTREEVLSRLKEQVEAMEEDLKRQTHMNRIHLSSCSSQMLESGGSRLLQQLSISGHCPELMFQVQFGLSEVKEDQRSERRIRDLNVVMDTSDLHSLSDFLSCVEESGDILLLFRTLRTFSMRCDERQRTFQHFQDKYPSAVRLPAGCGSEVMTLNHPQLPGCVLVLHWSFDVSREGGVTPKMDLLTKIPEKALQLFSPQTVGGATEAFQSLLRILGPEAAIESIIRAVSLSS
ncbi:centromere protein P [Thalassophryne amazonica]|uniref:centromere protein P n=1 Tax=Thalassophryne amazonica TaxID=390379 RepID=UPI001471C3D2|nr:centromere protein P [Thalassophryne amazonica]